MERGPSSSVSLLLPYGEPQFLSVENAGIDRTGWGPEAVGPGQLVGLQQH